MGPLPSPYGHDFPRLVDELVPGFTGEIDDIVVRLEDPVIPICRDGDSFWACAVTA